MIHPAVAAAHAVFDRRLDPSSAAPLAVGFSGGSDSLALLLCARTWTARHRRPLLALTVDHQLHPESAGWTAAAGETAGRLGVGWRALSWRGAKPGAGLPAAARRARHALLAQAARAAGARVLMLGHTADDAAESELIRSDTPSHGRLASWTPSPVWPEGRGVFLLRPLLGLGRRDLRSWLAGQQLDWLDDPANVDPRYARSRARAALARSAATIPASTDPPRPTAPWSAAGSAALPRLHPGGVLELDPQRLGRTPHSHDRLAKALLCVAGGERPPRGPALDRLKARIGAGAAFGATLAGARIQLDAGGLRLARELGRVAAPAAPLAMDVDTVFDGRFVLGAQAAGWRVQALAGHMAALSKPDRAALQAMPALARPSLPVLLGPGGEVTLPAPFGRGPAQARTLVGERLAGAWGLVADESEIPSGEVAKPYASAAGVLILS